MRIAEKEEFHRLLKECCETFLNNEEELFELSQRLCLGVEVVFTFEPDSIPTMQTKVTQAVIRR